MAKFFIIDNSIIVNMILADTKEIAEQVTGLSAIEVGSYEVIGVTKGATFDSALGFYVNPKPYESWVMNTETHNWEAPVAYPQDDFGYIWDEDSISWVVNAED